MGREEEHKVRAKRHNPRTGHPQAPRGRGHARRGQDDPEVAKALEVSENTFHRWRKQYGGLKAEDAKRLKELETDSSDELLERATYLGHVWALDFCHDATEAGVELRFSNVVDEFTREALATDVARSFTADATVEVIERLAREHGQPAFIRMDNGSELTAQALAELGERSEVATTYIEPGCPWQNPWIESFNARFRDEALDSELFSSILEARVIADVWRDTYNRYHPHSSLGMLAPAVFAERWRADHTEGVAMS
jgi:putative transposase